MSKDGGPIQPELKGTMNALASGIDDILNEGRKPGQDRKIIFCMLVAEAGKYEGGRVNFISNGRRDDMMKMTQEWLERSGGKVVLEPQMMGYFQSVDAMMRTKHQVSDTLKLPWVPPLLVSLEAAGCPSERAADMVHAMRLEQIEQLKRKD